MEVANPQTVTVDGLPVEVDALRMTAGELLEAAGIQTCRQLHGRILITHDGGECWSESIPMWIRHGMEFRTVERMLNHPRRDDETPAVGRVHFDIPLA